MTSCAEMMSADTSRTARRSAEGAAMSHARGVAALRAGRLDEALALFDLVLAESPSHADALNDSGIALAQLGRTDEALARFVAAVTSSPSAAGAQHNLGLLYKQLGRFDDAADSFARSTTLDATNPDWWVDLGNVALERQRPDEALAAYDRALARAPRLLSALANRALALRALMRIDEAEAACRQALTVDPTYADAWSNLGMLLKEADRLGEAADALARAQQLAPDSVVIGANLCALQLQAGNRDAALAIGQALVQQHPDAAEAWNALGHAQLEAAQFDASEASCDRALVLAPGDATAQFNRAVIRLLRGDYARGWEDYEARRYITNQLVHIRRPSGAEWNGAPLHGETLLLSGEQGAGDMLQFIRYAALAKQAGAGRVIVETQPALAELLETSPGVDAIAPTNAPLPAHDLHVPLLSLPRLLNTRVDSMPSSVPYLRAPARPVADRVRQARGLRIGFVWSGNPRQNRNRTRSVPLGALLEALAVPGVSLFSLQVGHAPDITFDAAVQAGLIVDLAPDLRSFADTAAAIDACDLVVSVCTSVAHLAGALGARTFTLLAHVADWRWLEQRDDSPWYPTMRLFRQERFDDWQAPLVALRQAVIDLTANARPVAAAAAPATPPSPMVSPAARTVNVEPQFRAATQLHVAGRIDEALVAYDAVLALAPTHAEALNNSAVILAQRGEVVEAERRAVAATVARPAYGQAHNNVALMRRSRGDLHGACDAFARAIEDPSAPGQWWLDFANCATELKRHETALRAFDRARVLMPKSSAVVADRAIALRGAARLNEAIDACREAITLDRGNASAWANLGMFLKETRQWDAARAALTEGLTAIPDHPLLLANLATLHLEWGDLDQSLAVADRLVAAHPGHAEGYNGRGCVLLERAQFAEAERAFRDALARDPHNGNAEWNLAFLAMLLGDLTEGFRGFERRLTLNSFVVSVREIPGQSWHGEPLNGRTIFVHEEQGLGDTLQFARYAADLKARGAGRVIVETTPDAAELVRTMPGVDAVAFRGEALPAYDVYVPLMSLPYRCGTTRQAIPARVPYIQAPRREVASRITAPEGVLKVGITWGGNPNNQRDRYRSVPIAALLNAVQMDGVQLFSIQKGGHAKSLAPLAGLFGVVDLDPHLQSLGDTASVITALDLVVTIDTSMAHLAGALGAPTWTLLCAVPDWRWFLDGTESPWYPTMRLFRQAAPGDWSRPLGQLRTALVDQVRAHAAR